MPKRPEESITLNLKTGSAGGAHANSEPQRPLSTFRPSRYELCLFLLFLLSLPLCNPWVHGDGVGYYAYARSLIIEHRLDFEEDWKRGNESFVMGRVDKNGQVRPEEYSPTGHVKNIWSVGPSLLWAPFLVVAHAGVAIANRLGAHIAADGFSYPYRITVALATCLYAFLGLWLSFRLARYYFDEKWSFLATVGIWGASSLPVYMYFNPFWSHAISAFGVALFLWYWHRTPNRTAAQWTLLGFISGLMVDIYYPNGLLLLLPLMEAVAQYANGLKRPGALQEIARLARSHALYGAAFVCGILPTLISRRIIFGSYFHTGYYPAGTWNWTSPALWKVLWSSEHGLLSWTPILILALAGIFVLRFRDRPLATKLAACSVAFYLLIALYPNWNGLSSFGNRFFVSLTPIFVVGLAAFFDWFARIWSARRAIITASALTALLILWNFGMMYQWGTHLIPARGPISWRDTVYNQFAVVPGQAVRTLERYVLRRSQLMQHIEDEDIKQLRSHPSQ